MTHSARVQKLQEKLKQVRQKLKELQDERDSELEKLSKKLEEEQYKDDLNIANGTLDDINKEIMKFKQHISATDRLSKKLTLSAAHLQQSKASILMVTVKSMSWLTYTRIKASAIAHLTMKLRKFLKGLIK